jgi:uncharacterized Zn-binding protein involved in type VI secretion
MIIPIKAGDPASCGHPATGSPNVFINGKGATRVGLDIAGATILGPGKPTVFVNGLPISVVGDIIVGHGEPPHSSPVTTSTGGTVFV